MVDRPAREVTRAQLVIGLASQAFLFVVAGGFLWWLSGRSLEQFVVFDWRGLALGIAMGVAMIAAAGTVFRAFPRFLEWTARQQAKQFAFLEKTASLPVFAWISLCAGVGEEALFRGGLVPLIGDHLGVSAAIGVTALGFALIHLAKPAITGLLFVIGCLFGAAYWYTGSLLAVMIGHVLYDVWALVVLHRTLQRIGYGDGAEIAAG